MAIELINRKNGRRYRAVVRVHHRKHSRCFDRKTDAEAWERTMLLKRDSGEIVLWEAKQLEQKEQASFTLDRLRERFDQEYSLYL